MSQSKLNKILYTDITKLKLCSKSDGIDRFLLEQSPFRDEDEEMTGGAQAQQAYLIIGQIFPKSDIYRERAFRIEMKLTDNFPAQPPDVRFLTKIYHPNIGLDGIVCHKLIKLSGKWTMNTSLVEVVKAVTELIDKPDVDSSSSFEVGKQYMENRAEFNKKALEMVKEHGLPRQ